MPEVTNSSSTESLSKIESSDQFDTSKQTSWQKLIRSRSSVIGLLFGAMGVLGIPLLCISPVFSFREKCLFSVLVTIHTGILAALAFWSCRWAWNEIQNAFF